MNGKRLASVSVLLALLGLLYSYVNTKDYRSSDR